MNANARKIEQVQGLKVLINKQEVGVLTHYSNGKNIFAFSPNYLNSPIDNRKTFTLTQIANEQYLSRPLISNQRLAPVLANLLPEGALRKWLSYSLKIHIDNEFPLLAHMGENLPGAIVTKAIIAGEVPQWALDHREQLNTVQMNTSTSQNKFSLAGEQMKFSATENEDGRFTIGQDNDHWIIKTPSTIHKHVPYNEYSVMRLAEAVGVDIPEIKLINLAKLNNLPNIQLPNETEAYAIKRFDRTLKGRVHSEDFAQIFQIYPHEKYHKFNYEQIASALYHYSATPLKDVQQMARRLLVNMLLGNGDAHLKNWSVIYPNGKQPTLSPAYDIVSTLAYINNEQESALNMAKNKHWYHTQMSTFKIWSERINIPWLAIKVHLEETLELARKQWLTMLDHLPMHSSHKQMLIHHWKNLHKDFQIK